MEEVKWHHGMSIDELVNLFVKAEEQQLTEFFISYVGGKKKYEVSRECYPSIFSVLVTRDELVGVIESQTEY